MSEQTNYYFLSVFFFVMFLLMEATDIYEPPPWFKAFLLILCTAFLVSGLNKKTGS